MADPTTTNIVLAVPARGSDVGTWDIPLNGDMTIIDACFGSVTSKALTSGTTALSVTEAQVNVIRLTGTLTGNALVTIPAIVKSWSIDNQCVVGAYAVTLQNASGGQIIGLPPGEITDVLSDGTNMRYRNMGRVGSYLDIATAAVPAWVTASTVPPYLLCDGSTFSAVTYPTLAAILGGTTLPDSRARSRIPLDGGTGRVTTASSGIDGATRFAAGGAQAIILAQSKLPNVAIGVTGNVTISNPSGFQAPASGFTLLSLNSGPDGYAVNAFNYSTLGLSAAFSGGTTASLNGGVAQQDQTVMQPTYVGGVTLIRAA